MKDTFKELAGQRDEYLKPTPDRVVDQKIVGLVSDYVIPRLAGRRILELGVGDQVWTPKLVSRFPDVTTIDGSADLLAEMERRLAGRPWTPVCTLFEEYRPEEPFDTVLATYVLEHVDDPGAILELARDSWLKARGRLAVVVPHALSLHRRLAVGMELASSPADLGETDRRMGHKRCFLHHELEKTILDRGFRIIEKQGMFTKVLPNRLLVGCGDDQLRGLFYLGLELPIEYSSIIYFLAEKTN